MLKVKVKSINASTMDSSTKHFQEEVCKTIKHEFSSLRGDFKSVSQDLKQRQHRPPQRNRNQNDFRAQNSSEQGNERMSDSRARGRPQM